MYYHMGTSTLKRVKQEIQTHNSFPRLASSSNMKAGIRWSDDIYEIITANCKITELMSGMVNRRG